MDALQKPGRFISANGWDGPFFCVRHGLIYEFLKYYPVIE